MQQTSDHHRTVWQCTDCCCSPIAACARLQDVDHDMWRNCSDCRHGYSGQLNRCPVQTVILHTQSPGSESDQSCPGVSYLPPQTDHQILSDLTAGVSVTCCAQVAELERLRRAEETRLKGLLKQQEVLKAEQFKRSQKLFELRSAERELISDISGGQGQNKNLAARISALDEQVTHLAARDQVSLGRAIPPSQMLRISGMSSSTPTQLCYSR